MCIMNNKILLLAATALLAFACGKTDYPEYEWGPQDDTTKVEVSFVNSTDNLELDPAINSLTVELTRSITTDALSVPLNITDTSGMFVIPATADFVAGAANTTITIDISKMELETKYEVNISIPSEYCIVYKTTGTNYCLKALKQKWIEAGTCTYYDCYSYYETGWAYADDVPIQRHEGTDDFRIIAPYVAMFPTNTALKPVNILFSVVMKNKKPDNITFSPAGLWHLWADSIYDLYWDSANYGNYCYADHSYDSDYDCHLFEVHTLGANLSTGKLGTWGAFAFEWYDCPVDFPKE